MDKQGILMGDKYEPGDMVSSDQFDVTIPGRKLTGYGRERAKDNSASGYILFALQCHMKAGPTVLGKARFKEMMWNLGGEMQLIFLA